MTLEDKRVVVNKAGDPHDQQAGYVVAEERAGVWVVNFDGQGEQAYSAHDLAVDEDAEKEERRQRALEALRELGIEAEDL